MQFLAKHFENKRLVQIPLWLAQPACEILDPPLNGTAIKGDQNLDDHNILNVDFQNDVHNLCFC